MSRATAAKPKVVSLRDAIAKKELKRTHVTLTLNERGDTHEFVFRGLGITAWEEILAQHPPRIEDTKLGLAFNSGTFPAAVMAASCVDPTDASLDLFELLATKVTSEEWGSLWAAAFRANTG